MSKVKTGSYSFWDDLARSDKVEEQVVSQLRDICGDSFVNATFGEKKKEYDVLLQTIFGSKKIEIKTDYSHAKYSNVAVEFQCRGKPSGIEASEADYWIYKIFEADGTSGLYMLEADKLRWLINDKLYHREVLNGGDVGSGTGLYLFKGDLFKSHCRLLHTYEKE